MGNTPKPLYNWIPMREYCPKWLMGGKLKHREIKGRNHHCGLANYLCVKSYIDSRNQNLNILFHVQILPPSLSPLPSPLLSSPYSNFLHDTIFICLPLPSSSSISLSPHPSLFLSYDHWISALFLATLELSIDKNINIHHILFVILPFLFPPSHSHSQMNKNICLSEINIIFIYKICAHLCCITHFKLVYTMEQPHKAIDIQINEQTFQDFHKQTFGPYCKFKP